MLTQKGGNYWFDQLVSLSSEANKVFAEVALSRDELQDKLNC